jgi:hypothetical protein
MLYALVYALPAAKLASKPPEGSLLGGQVVTSSIWSVFVCIAFLALVDLIMVHQDWFVPFTADAGVGLEEWQKRGNNFEAALLFLWSAWVYIDIPLAYAAGGLHRSPIYTNWRLILIAASLWTTTLVILFSHAGEFGCYFKVACNAGESALASNSFINYFLFPYEQVGGTWYNSQIDSTEFPLSFKLGVFFLFLTMSIIHHTGQFFIRCRLSKFFERIGWNGSPIKQTSPHKDTMPQDQKRISDKLSVEPTMDQPTISLRQK